MKSRRLLIAACAIYLVAWCIPANKHLTTGFPGWEALLVALTPLTDGIGDDPLWLGVVYVTSGFTNLWFIGGAIALWRGGSRARGVVMWGSAATFLLNAIWPVTIDVSDLRPGYYLWWLAFLLLAASARLEPPRTQ